VLVSSLLDFDKNLNIAIPHVIKDHLPFEIFSSPVFVPYFLCGLQFSILLHLLPPQISLCGGIELIRQAGNRFTNIGSGNVRSGS
jgi:hypothetical protein